MYSRTESGFRMSALSQFKPVFHGHLPVSTNEVLSSFVKARLSQSKWNDLIGAGFVCLRTNSNSDNSAPAYQ